ncbi:hypothetical protein Np200711_036 [Cyanophage S-RIM44]|nr:hypothetical protein Np200711_036 [Cyanophage S-RIM44]
MGGFGGQSLVTTSNYYGPGTYTLSATSINSGGGPWGIAIDWVDAVPPPPVPGCTDPRASNYNPNADVDNGTCSYPTPSISFSINPTNYIAPNSATLTWSVSGATSQSIDQGIGSVNSSGSLVVSPNNSRSYKLDASYYGITSATRTVDLTVYQPVNVSISSVPASIITGGIAQLTWVTSGDASSASIDQGVGAVLLSSSRNVSPSVTTTYTLSASGLGGSDTDSATVTVFQRPTLSQSVPTVIEYNGSFTANTTTEYANNNVSASYIFNYLDGSTDNAVVNGSPNADAVTPGQVTQDLSTVVPWTDFGPNTIIVTFSASGDGGIVTESETINVNIDQLPDNITIPDNLDELPLDQIAAPDVETVLSDPIVVTGIDIPVTIKSNFPIQVRFDDNDPDIESNWNDVQQI